MEPEGNVYFVCNIKHFRLTRRNTVFHVLLNITNNQRNYNSA
jgi:hypothetical protein